MIWLSVQSPAKVDKQTFNMDEAKTNFGTPCIPIQTTLICSFSKDYLVSVE